MAKAPRVGPSDAKVGRIPALGSVQTYPKDRMNTSTCMTGLAVAVVAAVVAAGTPALAAAPVKLTTDEAASLSSPECAEPESPTCTDYVKTVGAPYAEDPDAETPPEGDLGEWQTTVMTDPVVSGVATSSTGGPASGASISLYLLGEDSPTTETVLTPFASTRTTSTGAFSVPLQVTPELLQAAVDNGGYTNFQMMVLDEAIDNFVGPDLPDPLGTMLGENSHHALNGGKNGDAFVKTFAVRWLTLQEGITGSCSLVFQGACYESLTDLPDATTSSAAEVPTAVTFSMLPTVDSGLGLVQPANCYTSVKKIGAQDQWTKIGELHTYFDTVGGKFEYGKTADSDIGTAVKVGSGNWEAGGSYHVGNKNSGATGLVRGSYYGRQLTTLFHYVQEKFTTYCPFYTREDYTIRAARWNGGLQEANDVSSYDGANRYYKAEKKGYATRFLANSYHERKKNKSYTYKGAVAAFGVGLDARSGYSTNVDLRWDFGSSNFFHGLFGNNGPITTSSIIYAY